MEGQTVEPVATKPDKVKCPDCGKEVTQRGLNTHRRWMHSKQIETKPEQANTKPFIGGGSMSKIIESSNCPTCGTKSPTGGVQKYEVPTVPVVSEDGLNTIKASLDNLSSKLEQIKLPEVDSLKEGIAGLDSKLAKIGNTVARHPKPTKDFIKHFWEDCPECNPSWQAIKDEIARSAIENCPNCKAKDEKIAGLEKKPTKPFWEA